MEMEGLLDDIFESLLENVILFSNVILNATSIKTS